MNNMRIFPILVVLAVLLSGSALLLSAASVSADPIYVDQDAAGTGDGLSWTNAFTEVQLALAAAVAGDDIWVAEGVYYPNFDPVTHVYTPSRGAWFSLPNDVRLYGGFAGGETALAQRDWAAHPTVLSGDIDRNDQTDARGVVNATDDIVGENAYTLINASYLSAASAVDGFYITGGQANSGEGEWYQAQRSGGGLYSGGGSATLRNLVVIGNYAEYGGGAALYNASLTLVNIAFHNNSAVYGGGLYAYNYAGTLINLTFSGNTASQQGGGLCINGSLTVINSILWGNSPQQIYGTATVTYSIVQGGYTGALDADPLFVDAAAGDLRLEIGSPATDAGNTAALPADAADLDGDSNTTEALPYDLTRYQRVAGSAVDMGAYEVRPPLYVDKDAAGANNGSSWANAYTNLQSALTAATSGDEIWVAEGAYLPTAGADRYATFALKSGVAIYGGFVATETMRSQRDWTGHVTTLSGDIGAAGVITDNVYHVATGSNVTRTTILDGFTISGGCADGSGIGDSNGGGGMLTTSGSPIIRNVTFTGNYARDFGGGLYTLNPSSPLLVNVSFISNTATHRGGGIANLLSSHPELVNVVFLDNAATDGGGMGAYAAAATLTNVTFGNNHASDRGGGMFNEESRATLVNVAFYGNSAKSGGGLNNYYHCNTTLTNVSFAHNHASESGGGIYDLMGTPTLRNAIVWDNTPDQVDRWDSSPTVTYSDIEGGCPTGATCSNVINSDPQWLDAANGDLRLRLSSPALDAGDNTAVPADAADLDGDGNTAEPLPFDLSGGPRFFDAIAPDAGNGAAPLVDMGAYETTRRPIFVDTHATGVATGLSWTDAFTEVQSALAIAVAEDEIWVAEGVYYPNFDPVTHVYTPSRGMMFSLPNDVGLYGGFAGDELARVQRNWSAHPTVLSGDIDRNDPTDARGVVTAATYIVGDNAYTVLNVSYLSAASAVDGFFITGGQSNGTGGNNWEPHRSGGGVYAGGGAAVLRNLVIIGNYAETGGGAALYNSSLTLVNSAFLNNVSSGSGGGVYLFGDGYLANLTLYGNSANLGGGILEAGGNPTVVNCILWANSAVEYPQASPDLNLTYSDVQGGYTGAGNLEADPLFMDAPGGNLRLQLTSPAIDAGSNTAVPTDTLDLDGDGDFVERLPDDLGGSPRFADILSRPDTGLGTPPLVDMGAYETQDAPDLLIVKTASTPEAVPGQTVTYTLNFSNVGGVTATQIVITDIIPISLTQVSSQWVFPGGQITRTGGIAYIWSVSNLAPGQGGVITLTGVVSASAVAGEIVNTASIAGAVDVVDGNNRSSATIILNGPPTANGDPCLTDEDIPLHVLAPGVLGNDTDPNGDTLQAMVVTPPAHGTLTLNVDGSFFYTPTANWNGIDIFTYRAGDGMLWSDPAAVSITVSPVNDPPVAADDTSNTSMNTPRVISVLGNDTDLDDDPLTIAAVSTPNNGAVAILGATILYTPNVGYLGEDTFGYILSDSGGLTDTARVTVTVGAVNQPPVAVDDAITTTQNTPVTIPVLSNDLNPDMDTLFVAGISTPTHGAAAIQGATVVYTPALDYVGVDTFAYIVSDGQFTSTAGVSVTIYDVTAPQVVAVSPLHGATGVTVTASIVITFSEAISTATFAYAVSPDPGGWSAAWSAAGDGVTLTHAPFAYGVTYTVTLTAAPDLAGNPLATAPYVWMFTTVPQAENYHIFLPLVLRN